MVLSMLRMHGDPEELLEQKRKMDEGTMELADQAGGLAHIVVRTDDGLLMVNLYADADGPDRMAELMREKRGSLGPAQDAEREVDDVVQCFFSEKVGSMEPVA